MCHDFATEVLGAFKKFEKYRKSKKPANPLDLQVLPRFLRAFEKIEKPSFSLLLPFWWGEQESNFTAQTRIYATFL